MALPKPLNILHWPQNKVQMQKQYQKGFLYLVQAYPEDAGFYYSDVFIQLHI